MAVGFQITCVNRNPAGMIVRVGGVGWSLALHEAIVRLVSGRVRLSITVDGQTYDIGVRGEGFEAYLTLEPDGTPLHTLNDLPSC